MSDLDAMARTLYGEARGEDDEGKIAVANVILNRFDRWDTHPHFGTGTVESVCLAPWQFSCWNTNDPNLPKLKAVTEDDPAFLRCMDIAGKTLDGQYDDNTNGATYYKVIGTHAAWADGETPCAVIGHHEFYKDIA